MLDIYMLGMIGVDLWRAPRDRGFQVPTILITGHHDQPTRLYAEQVDAVSVLYKPVEEKDLFEAIDRALTSKHT